MSYNINCRVSGGYTGTREALLKDHDGKIESFDSLEAAQARASDLNKRMNHQYSTASFRYTVVEEGW